MNKIPESVATIARILRVDKDETLLPAVLLLEELTGRKGILDSLAEENRMKIVEKFDLLGIGPDVAAQEAYDALISKIEADDLSLFELFGRPDYKDPAAYNRVLSIARETAGVGDGYFLKYDKARELMINQPPQKIMAALGYRTVSDMLAKEDLAEVYSALRFLEDAEWQNTVFFKQYESLRPSDFEHRKIELKALPSRWVESAKPFMQKKYHNLSHLKELGVIFVIPWSLGYSGETMRMFSLLAHYLHEVEFYSQLFERFAKDPEMFAESLIAALRGDVSAKRPTDDNTWLIVQRYLEKDDENEWRLFWPHINPEADHWIRAELDLARMGTQYKIPGLTFWKGLDWVGDYFKTDSGIDVLVSFDLIDTAMSLVYRNTMTKYFYHHQEALWNKIFVSFVGEEEARKLVIDNFADHEIKLSKLGLMWQKLKKS